MLLAAEHIEKNYGMKRLIRDASLYLDTGDKVGIIGINGTGNLRCCAFWRVQRSRTAVRCRYFPMYRCRTCRRTRTWTRTQPC